MVTTQRASRIDPDRIERDLCGTAPVGAPFDPAELDGLPAPVQRYLTASIAAGTPASSVATLHMRGEIRLGRWIPFTATEVLAPHRGFLWRWPADPVVRQHRLGMPKPPGLQEDLDPRGEGLLLRVALLPSGRCRPGHRQR
jgi:hypothetical protein